MSKKEGVMRKDCKTSRGYSISNRCAATSCVVGVTYIVALFSLCDA